MKVMLIHPPYEHMIRTNVPKSVDYETGVYPPLGLLYVAAGLSRWTRARVDFLDAVAMKLDQDGIAAHMARIQPDVVGIQAMTFTIVDAIRTVQTAKRVCPRCHVCLGGPHVNIFPAETIAIDGVDSLVLGEGERVFADLVNAIAEGADASGIPGVLLRGQEQGTACARALEESLDDIPHPDRGMIDNNLYWSVLAKRNPVTTMMTSRGCPYKCIFCDRPHLGKRFRCRSAVNVVDEMEDCVRRGIGELFLYDDTFTIDRKRVFEIRDELARRNIKVGWDVRARANTLDSDVVNAMKEAGVARIHIGVESGSPRILKVLKKGITVEQAHQAFELCRKHRLTSLAYFMLGNPTETIEDIEMTMRFIRKCKADYAHIALTTPFPGTELYTLALEQGLYKVDHWKMFAAVPDENFMPPAWTENFTQSELDDLRRRAYIAFYNRPGRLARELLGVRSLGEFRKKIRLGISLLFRR